MTASTKVDRSPKQLDPATCPIGTVGFQRPWAYEFNSIEDMTDLNNDPDVILNSDRKWVWCDDVRRGGSDAAEPRQDEAYFPDWKSAVQSEITDRRDQARQAIAEALDLLAQADLMDSLLSQID